MEQDTDEDEEEGERRRRRRERRKKAKKKERRMWRVGKGKARGAVEEEVRYSGCSYEVASASWLPRARPSPYDCTFPTPPP